MQRVGPALVSSASLESQHRTARGVNESLLRLQSGCLRCLAISRDLARQKVRELSDGHGRGFSTFAIEEVLHLRTHEHLVDRTVQRVDDIRRCARRSKYTPPV